ncbi:hypothetical protein ACH4UR_26540 [Streptomyces lydicus]|uniref:hypothetical protein n=1 Tax=Streptomyces lydicus TaxID=47763 RepID=UPI0033D7A017
MGTFFTAAAVFPTLLFTAALVMVVAFWVLVAVGVANSGSFDTDADLDAWGMGEVPVAVAFSVLTVIAWSVSLVATMSLDPMLPPGVGRALLRVAVLAAALLAAWGVTRLLVRAWLRVLHQEPGPLRADCAGQDLHHADRADARGFGPAESAAEDGSPVLAQDHQAGAGPLADGSAWLFPVGDGLRGTPCAPRGALLTPPGHAGWFR